MTVQYSDGYQGYSEVENKAYNLLSVLYTLADEWRKLRRMSVVAQQNRKNLLVGWCWPGRGDWLSTEWSVDKIDTELVNDLYPPKYYCAPLIPAGPVTEDTPHQAESVAVKSQLCHLLYQNHCQATLIYIWHQSFSHLAKPSIPISSPSLQNTPICYLVNQYYMDYF